MTAKYITPEQVCEIIPGMTKANLASLRFKGTGPRFFKPTERVVVYLEEDVFAWLERSARLTTARSA